jgi:hypothetical protein
VKQSEAVHIPALLAARRPRPAVEEVIIEGIRMLVVLGDQVDSVIRYTRGGGADMPQLSSYPEVAESAAHVDERLAKQRASGRANTTGEGFNWPRNWKLSAQRRPGRYGMPVIMASLRPIHRQALRVPYRPPRPRVRLAHTTKRSGRHREAGDGAPKIT